MKERTKTEPEEREHRDTLTDLLRAGAQKLIAEALEAEVAAVLAGYAKHRDEAGRALVVRSGHHPEREIQTGIGPVTVQVPKVRRRQGKPVTVRSALIPPSVRKTRSLEAALPWLYLKGIATGEMQTAWEALVGPEAKGLSASTVARLKQVWREEYQSWRQQVLDEEQWGSIGVDGIYSGLRADEHRLGAVVVLGVNSQGRNACWRLKTGSASPPRAGGNWCCL